MHSVLERVKGELGSAFESPARSQLCRGPLGLALLPGMAAALLCLLLPAAARHVPARSAPHAASGPNAGTPQLAPAAPHGCSQGWHCQPVCAPLSPWPQPCCQGQPRGCQLGDPHTPRTPSSFSHSNPACLCWVSLPWSFSCSTYTLLPVCSRFPSLCPAARVPRHVCSPCLRSASLFISLSLPPAYSTSDTMGLFFFFPLSCSFWLPRPLISFGVWEERREEEGGWVERLPFLGPSSERSGQEELQPFHAGEQQGAGAGAAGSQ